MGGSLVRQIPNKIYIILFCISLLLNIFFFCQHFFFLPPSWLGSTGSELSWTQYAAEEAEAVAAISCSGHGSVYVDGVIENGRLTCECHTCYTGADCAVLLSNCSADVERLVIGRLCNISIFNIIGLLLIIGFHFFHFLLVFRNSFVLGTL
jgi:Alliinase EGF-like domain